MGTMTRAPRGEMRVILPSLRGSAFCLQFI